MAPVKSRSPRCHVSPLSAWLQARRQGFYSMHHDGGSHLCFPRAISCHELSGPGDGRSVRVVYVPERQVRKVEEPRQSARAPRRIAHDRPVDGEAQQAVQHTGAKDVGAQHEARPCCEAPPRCSPTGCLVGHSAGTQCTDPMSRVRWACAQRRSAPLNPGRTRSTAPQRHAAKNASMKRTPSTDRFTAFASCCSKAKAGSLHCSRNSAMCAT